MALFGTVETVRSQTLPSDAFAAAWTYVNQLLDPRSAIHQRMLAMPLGASEKHELAHGVVAIEQVYEAKERSDSFFESHRKYIDIQVIVAGQEIMEVVDVSRAIVRDPYNDQRDFVAYQDKQGASQLRMRSGDAAVFYPVDVHMPSLRSAGTPTVVRKSVLKVPVAS